MIYEKCVSCVVGAALSAEERVRTRTAQLTAKNAELVQLAHTDCLTGLPNRRAFLQAARVELTRMQRNNRPTCLLLGDIDHFKAFNDRCGHEAGDRVLQAVATTLRASTRAADSVARWGGEEMLMLLPETDLAGAESVAEKCRLAVQACQLSCRAHPLKVTMTFGVCMILPVETIEAAIARADAAMYAGKGLGRNRVAVAQNGNADKLGVCRSDRGTGS